MDHDRNARGDARRRACDRELVIRGAWRKRAVCIHSTEHGEHWLRRFAAAIIEDICQLSAEASGVIDRIGIRHVEIEAVVAADEPFGDGDWMENIKAVIRELRGRNRVAGRLAVEQNFAIIIGRPLADDRCAIGAGQIKAEAVMIGTRVAVG